MPKKKRRRKTSLLTKAINVGVLAMALSPAINKLLRGAPLESYVDLYSAGLNKGSFNQTFALEAYGPMVAAIILKKAISMLRRTARI